MMREILSAAQEAKSRLSAALAALQSPGVPDSLLEAARPVAQAMGALHRIDGSSGQNAHSEGPVALDAIRRALGDLQDAAASHPVAEDAIALVAQGLGLVLHINQRLDALAGEAARHAEWAGMDEPSPHLLQRAPRAPSRNPTAQQPVALQHRPAEHRAPARPEPPPPHAQPPQERLQPPQAHAQPQAQPQPQALPPHAQMQQAPPQPPIPHEEPTPQSSRIAAPTERDARRHASDREVAHAAAQSSTPSKGSLPRIEAELGAHSSSNFYKGLGGNDVLDSGGIFVATYQAPEVGREVQLRVSLPGGYEFEATAVVSWTRAASDASSYAPPGFGARFTHIASEGKQLIYRYVRNREPLFHDDL